MTAPEDLVLFSERFVIMSSMEPTAHLYVFDTQSDVLSVIETTLKAANDLAPWGDASCSPPEQLATHGLDLTQRASGEWQLLAVNHGGRESIEYFSVDQAPATGTPSLQWRGCVMAAENAQFNDVAALPGGGFLATDPISASWQLPKLLGGAVGVGSGRVYRWDPESAYRAVPNTEGAYPNGITLSADKQSFYVNYYQEGEVREHDLESGEILNRQAVEQPDNSTLTADGSLLVASHHASLFTLLVALTSAENERTTIPYSIIAIDTASFSKSVRFYSVGEEMGAGTVAVPVGDDLYVGSFRGDRLIRVQPPAAPAPRKSLEN
ncbi:MAG: hypothetical protein Cons2KO_00630 [Congregibacter sp.]